MLGSVEPYVPVSGGNLAYLWGALLSVAIVLYLLRYVAIPLLAAVASFAAITVLVFLRTNMGVRVISIRNILIGVAFLYFIGNMIGHNYHDYYRDRNATIWGARVHFTYLVLFVVMAAYRRFRAGQLENVVKPSSPGGASRLAMFLPTHGAWAPRGGLYEQVLAEPLAVISVGLLLALVLQNWFGWYLILTACLLCYGNLYWYYERREHRLDQLDNPVKPEQ